MEQVLNSLISILLALIQFVMAFLNSYSQPAAPTTPETPTTDVTTTEVVTGTNELEWPVKSKSVVTSGYPTRSDGSAHGGIDIFLADGNSAGEPFYAAGAGKVLSAYNDNEYHDGFGNYCVIDHGNGLATLYAHASEIMVTVGQTVEKSQQIGKIGDTGKASGAHLHFEVRTVAADGTQTRVNPLDYVKNPYGTSAPSTPSSDTVLQSGTFTFTVYGWGHGVGMSQDGAIAMAKSGSTYSEILYHYYPGTALADDSSVPQTVTKNGSEVTMVEYLCKTVKQEIGDYAPYEALKAQAVCAYTYSKKFGYGNGQAYDSSFKYSGTNVEKAVLEVLGMTSSGSTPVAKYLTYNGKIAETYYFANSPGHTASAGSVWGGSYAAYLNGGVSSPEKVSITTKTYTVDELRAKIMDYASSAGVTITLGNDPSTWLKILSQDSAYSSEVGFISQISVGGYTMSGNSFRAKVLKNGVRSHCFTVVYTP